MKKYRVEVEMLETNVLRAVAWVEADSASDAVDYVQGGNYEGDLDFEVVGTTADDDDSFRVSSVEEVDKLPWD